MPASHGSVRECCRRIISEEEDDVVSVTVSTSRETLIGTIYDGSPEAIQVGGSILRHIWAASREIKSNDLKELWGWMHSYFPSARVLE